MLGDRSHQRQEVRISETDGADELRSAYSDWLTFSKLAGQKRRVASSRQNRGGTATPPYPILVGRTCWCAVNSMEQGEA
jgi:hypothetical protein